MIPFSLVVYLTFLNSFVCLVAGNSVLPSNEDKQVDLWKDCKVAAFENFLD